MLSGIVPRTYGPGPAQLETYKFRIFPGRRGRQLERAINFFELSSNSRRDPMWKTHGSVNQFGPRFSTDHHQ
jgi:hypothetical protein